MCINFTNNLDLVQTNPGNMSCCKECEESIDFYNSFRQEIPFTEKQISVSLFEREFSKETDPNLLKWHWDEEDREICSVYPTDWLFQFDDELPISLNSKIFINAGRLHRIIKGTGDLTVVIIKA